MMSAKYLSLLSVSMALLFPVSFAASKLSTEVEEKRVIFFGIFTEFNKERAAVPELEGIIKEMDSVMESQHENS